MKQDEVSPERFETGAEHTEGRSSLGKGSHTLESLWRQGIPPKIRQKLWPFIVQNKLCLTKKLYLMNLEEAQRIIKKLGKENKRGACIKGMNRAMVETIESEIV
jgi:hypothetical protein